ncbi:MAG: hypothetical protein JST40_09955 [Armatimonadetes bacterium]|nr:hypothetical protein [Armatimonadota bacterium]
MLITLLALNMLENPSLPFLSPVFADHMVLQRDIPNTFWGWTKPGTEVVVSVAGKSFRGKTDPTGKWSVKVTPPAVGGPYEVTVKGDQTVELKDVLVGDVWICSGQSNMEMGITMVQNHEEEVKAANRPTIRLMMVEKAISLAPEPITRIVPWRTCTPETIVQNGWGGFSAAGYFFGRMLNDELKVPIGLVESSWGGSVAEAWVSSPGLVSVKDFSAQLEALSKVDPKAHSGYGAMDNWVSKFDTLSKPNSSAYRGETDATWKEVKMPQNFHQLGIHDHQNVVWFARQFEVPGGGETGMPFLDLGGSDGVSTVYINGKFVAGLASPLYNFQRKLPDGILKSGTNSIAIRMIGHKWDGGLTWGDYPINIQTADGKRVELAGTWKMKVSASLDGHTGMPFMMEDNPDYPSTIHNSMIAPLEPMAIKGALWYQGESNVGRGEQYQRLLPALIADWRKGFGVGDFPFYIVQLANYGQRHPEPTDNGWAELQEAQNLTALKVKNAGLAVANDIGMPNDIHPVNKQEVGRRLALVALAKTYGQKIEYSGPVFKKAEEQGGELVVSFDHSLGLELRGDTKNCFAIAGKDGKFYWADARIEDDTVVLFSSQVKVPVYVRYAWDENPAVCLYNGAGLPASPFRNK